MSEVSEIHVQHRPSAVSQIDLVTAIMVELGRQGIAGANVRQINAIARAADMVTAEFSTPHRAATPDSGFNAWLLCDERGSSSNCLASHLARAMGHPSAFRVGRVTDDHPLDADDFGRCVKLLDAVPAFRPYLPEAAKISPAWAALVANWDELEKHHAGHGRSVLSSRIKAILDGVEKGAG